MRTRMLYPLVAAATLLVSTIGHAQIGGVIGLYVDEDGNQCDLNSSGSPT